MSLRDWFAGQALAGLLAGRATNSEKGTFREWSHGLIAEGVYMMADAMIDAREGGAN